MMIAAIRATPWSAWWMDTLMTVQTLSLVQSVISPWVIDPNAIEFDRCALNNRKFLPATVARLAKYLHGEGTPVLTPGGNSYEYMEKRKSCDDEFYMLVRTGFLNYKPLALFTVAIFKQWVWNVFHYRLSGINTFSLLPLKNSSRYDWKRVLYIYERDGQFSIGGQRTCHLTMSALAKYHGMHNISYSAFSTDSFGSNLTETLRKEVGYDNTSEWKLSYYLSTANVEWCVTVSEPPTGSVSTHVHIVRIDCVRRTAPY